MTFPQEEPIMTLSTNPLREGLRQHLTPEPCIMVIFGATGDLTRRKLVPALYHLALENLLPSGFSVLGFARRPWSHEHFREQMQEGVSQFSRNQPINPKVWESFSEGLFYLASSFDDADGYRNLREALEKIDRERDTNGNRVFYLATPPSAYAKIIAQIGQAGLAGTSSGRHGRGGWTRIIVEKPFGRDLVTAQELNRQLAEVFQEDQIYRIDHYLGKETVQNILVFRFANGIFEPLWNRRYIDHIQITASESIGVEGRGTYYEEAGTLRDMVQNHIFQLLSLVAMEPPAAFDATAVRDEKVKVLRAIRPISPDEVEEYTVRGQYDAGSISGRLLPRYREERGVSADSLTETFVALKLVIDNWRWAGVPFYLRSGKALPKRNTEIAIQFKSVPHMLFTNTATSRVEPNILALRIQPNEGISLKFSAKMPSPTVQMQSVNMDFGYGTSFGIDPPEAYERLLLDCMLGDSTLFTRRDEVETAWALLTSILEGWQLYPPQDFPNYEAGTWGPKAAHEWIARDGRRWRRL